MRLILFLSASLITLTIYAAPSQTDTNQGVSNTMSQKDVQSDQGESFLTDNKTKPGVITLPSGLQYKVIKAGEGEQPTDTDTVTVNYAGQLINGKEFDSSYKRGESISFPVNGVIPGWTEALKLMKVGSKWELYIPAKLAYGQRGAPPAIGPNQTLIFQVELLGVQRQ